MVDNAIGYVTETSSQNNLMSSRNIIPVQFEKENVASHGAHGESCTYTSYNVNIIMVSK